MEGPICVCVGEIWRAVCLGMSVCSQGLCVSFCVSRLPTSIMPWHSGREWDSDSFTNTRSVKLPVKLSCSVAILGIDKNTALKGKKLSSKCQRLCPCIKRERERERERKKKQEQRISKGTAAARQQGWTGGATVLYQKNHLQANDAGVMVVMIPRLKPL